MSKRSVALIVGVATLATVGALLFGLVVFRQIYRDRVYPGVHVAGGIGGVNLSGQTRDEAIRTLELQYDRFLRSPLQFKYLGREWQSTPRDLGVRVEVEHSVDEALAVGRAGDQWERLRAQSSVLRRGQDVEPPTVSVDSDKLTGYLREIGRAIEKSPTSADLALKPEGGVAVLASQSGRRLDVDRTVGQVRQALQSYQTGQLPLVVDDVAPALAESDLAGVRAQTEKIIGAPVTLRVELPNEVKSWKLERADLVDLLELRTIRTIPARYELQIDDERIRQYVEKIAPEIERPARNARFALDGGRLKVLRESEEGRRLEITTSIEAIRRALTSDDRTVTLPWQPVQPAFPSSDIGRISFPDQIERATTVYGGTLPERMFNVELATSRINGVVIGPGDSFSFNQEVGEVSYRSGYKKGYGISQDGDDVITIPSEGGGICQVATTVFQSVFWAGYPIVERNWHLYWIPRYGQRPKGLKGLDATIDQIYDAQGKLLYAVDLRWRNNTEAPVLLEAGTDGNLVTVTLWGRKPQWQVKVADPKIDKVVKADTKPVRQPDASLANGAELMIEHAEDGFQSTIVRSVFINGRLSDESKFVSTYRPSRNVFVYGGPAPKGTAAAAAPAAGRIEDRPATPASVPTQPPSVITPYATEAPTPRATVTPAPSRTGTPAPAAPRTPVPSPSPSGRG